METEIVPFVESDGENRSTPPKLLPRASRLVINEKKRWEIFFLFGGVPGARKEKNQQIFVNF